MKLLWVCVVANAIGLSLSMDLLEAETAPVGMNLLEAAATKCTRDIDCPQLTCHINTCSTSGYCKYTPRKVGDKCPGQSCTNGGACDDDVNDYCNASAECISAYKPKGTKCPGKSCSNGGDCDDDANDYCDGGDTCVSAFKDPSVVCRSSAGQCDTVEYCTGTAGTCPVDAFAPSSMTCSGANNGGACDGQDLCDGFGHCVDIYLPSSTVCRKSSGQCDVVESCSGSSSECPADAFASPATACTGTCNGNPCDGADRCDGKGNCVDIYLPSSVVCRNAANECDVAEVCSGSSGHCPADAFQSSSTKCTGTCNGGVCDDQDMCDGSGKCVDKYLPSSRECRASKGQCDVAETCTGSSSHCPTDVFQPSSTTCVGTCNDNDCDGIDKCDGKGNCVDVYLPSDKVCRPSKGLCDVQETCTGSSGRCPADNFAPSTTTCTGTMTGGECDGQDLCDGRGNCVDKFLSSSTVCRPSKSQCDVAEVCTGQRSECPVDSFACATTKCTGSSNGGACDIQDYCDGKGSCVDKYLPSSSVCRSSSGQCDVAETCSGSSGACPADAFAPSTTACTGTCNGNRCDGADHCDGKGNCVDVYLPSSTVCRLAANDCDIAESCTGYSGQCPSDKFEPTTTTCTGTCNGNPCDGVDKCDGKGNCVDKYLPSDTVCGNTKAGPCTIPATCTGDMGFCPPDEYADSKTLCTGQSSGNACDGKDTCDGEGNCVDRFLGGKTVCHKPIGYSRPVYCNGKSATCPVSSFLEGNLREMTADDPTPVQSMLVAVAPSSPMVLLGLVCVVAAAVAMVTMRQRRDDLALDDATYKLLATHEDASAAF